MVLWSIGNLPALAPRESKHDSEMDCGLQPYTIRTSPRRYDRIRSWIFIHTIHWATTPDRLPLKILASQPLAGDPSGSTHSVDEYLSAHSSASSRESNTRDVKLRGSCSTMTCHFPSGM